MINLWTNIDGIKPGISYIHDAEGQFILEASHGGNEFNSEIDNKALKFIDGVYRRDGRRLYNSFGSCDITEISTGCMTALLALNHEEYLVSCLEISDMALGVLLDIANKYEITINLLLTRTYLSYTQVDIPVMMDGVPKLTEEIAEETITLYENQTDNQKQRYMLDMIYRDMRL